MSEFASRFVSRAETTSESNRQGRSPSRQPRQCAAVGEERDVCNCEYTVLSRDLCNKSNVSQTHFEKEAAFVGVASRSRVFFAAQPPSFALLDST